MDYDSNTTPEPDGSINRYYDPGTGEFLTVDPLVDQTGQAYQYTGGDPVNASDPSGLYDGPPSGLGNQQPAPTPSPTSYGVDPL